MNPVCLILSDKCMKIYLLCMKYPLATMLGKQSINLDESIDQIQGKSMFILLDNWLNEKLQKL
jgi:hypothetical protein